MGRRSLELDHNIVGQSVMQETTFHVCSTINRIGGWRKIHNLEGATYYIKRPLCDSCEGGDQSQTQSSTNLHVRVFTLWRWRLKSNAKYHKSMSKRVFTHYLLNLSNNIIMEMLTYVLKTQVKKLKIEVFSWNLCIQHCKSSII